MKVQIGFADLAFKSKRSRSQWEDGAYLWYAGAGAVGAGSFLF